MLLKLWFDPDVAPPEDGEWYWAKTQPEAEDVIGLNINNAEADLLLSVGGDGSSLSLVDQVETYAKFGAIQKPIWLEQHVEDETIAALIKKTNEHWGLE